MLKPQRNEVRELICLDGLWHFRRDPSGDGENQGWSNGFAAECEIAVPASWNEQRADLTHFFGRGWYQTHFYASSHWLLGGVRLHVGSAQRHARVWVNGHLVGKHCGGSLPFEIELETAIIEGKNLLVIEVDGSLDPWDLPPARLLQGEERIGFHNSHPAVTYDFFPYAGLSRSISIQLTPTPLRLQTINVVAAIEPGNKSAKLNIELSWTREFSHLDLMIEIQGHPTRVNVSGKTKVTVPVVVDDPRLWDVGRPELYEMRATLLFGDRVYDCYLHSFGIRTVEVRGDSLLLNGRPVFLTGFGKHEDFAILGRGYCAPLLVRDFDLLNWVGANSFRTSHYPYAEEWYEYADRHGILVIGETPLVGLNSRMYRAETLARACELTREMILRDRHHPCVVMWSLANEPDIDTQEGDTFFRTLASGARQLDPTRPITYVAHREPEQNRPMEVFDIVCLNKYYGWYEQPGDIEGALKEFGACLDRFRAAFNKPLILAEFGADALEGLHMQPPEMFSEEFQADIIAAQYLEARRRPWVIGTHVWAFADFKTAQSITRVALNRKGVFTRDRKPKMAAHRLRALWNGPLAPESTYPAP